MRFALLNNYPRGIRNNNPGNIKHNPNNQWQGMRSRQTDPVFVQFISPEYGFRAMAKLLKNYQRRGLNTVTDIISTYAPSTENHTQSYIRFVAKEIKVNPDDELNLDEYMPSLLKAIATFENGSQFKTHFTENMISEGIALANASQEVIA